jgi:hypothetical protein
MVNTAALSFLWPVLFCGLFGSCIPEVVNSRARGPEQKSTITALADKDEVSGEEAELGGISGEPAGFEDTLVLERGNAWTAGIPGFGENALSAFSGEYRIPGKTELLKVWLCRELLYYEGWNAAAEGVFLKTLAGGSLAAIPARDGIWTAVVLLPPGSPEEQNRLLRACMSKFSGFSGSGSSQNLSLPAIISF